jgi:hypothetical protein
MDDHDRAANQSNWLKLVDALDAGALGNDAVSPLMSRAWRTCRRCSRLDPAVSGLRRIG